MDDDRRPATGQLPRVIGKVIKSDGEVSVVENKPAAPRAPARAGVVNAEEFDARKSAKQIIEDAERRRAEILDEANHEREAIYAKAVEDAQAEVLAAATEELARAKLQAGELLASAEGEMVALALKIAAKIIGRDLERDPELVAEIAATAIEQARAAKAMVLRVNPRDGALLRERRPKLMELIGRTVELAIRDDSDVELGGCIIQTEFGTIDAQIKTQFEMLSNVLYPDNAKREGPK